MEIIVVAVAILAFLLLFVPASLLPLLLGAAVGSDTIDSANRYAFAEPVVERGWGNDESIAA